MGELGAPELGKGGPHFLRLVFNLRSAVGTETDTVSFS